MYVFWQISKRWFPNTNLKSLLGGDRGVMVIVIGNGHGDTSSNLDEADRISHSLNTLGKGLNPVILPPAVGR